MEHVPKFGNWEAADNVPYTAFFENARKEKGSGGGGGGRRNNKVFNPNDPEDNPEAFLSTIHSPIRERRPEGTSGGGDRENRHYGRKQGSRRFVEARSPVSSPPPSLRWQVVSPKSRSPHHPEAHNHRGGRGGGAAATLPKFGSWDDTDPTSGAAFTAIFSKVKEESKQPVAGVQLLQTLHSQKQGKSSSSMRQKERQQRMGGEKATGNPIPVRGDIKKRIIRELVAAVTGDRTGGGGTGRREAAPSGTLSASLEGSPGGGGGGDISGCASLS